MDAPHAQSAEAVLDQLDVSPEAGLSQDEAERRLAHFGPNRLQQVGRRSVWQLLYEQFKSVVILLLVAAAAGSFAFGEIAQGIAIVVAILINTAIGFFTERQAQRSMAALSRLEQVHAQVRRDGQERELPADQLVPGDIVLLGMEDAVPADVRLLRVENLRCNESALTGESVPVNKSTEPVADDAPLAERAGMAFKGTGVSQGRATAVVVGTGMGTELGRISALAEEAGEGGTPLSKRLDLLGRRLVYLTVGVAAVIVVIGLVVGRDLMLMVETGIALAVAAVPEGLPVVASIALARGMWRMARRNAVIKQLAAVETLGSVNIIFADKTGTLTENRMTVRRFALPDGDVAVGGEDGGGGFRRDSEPVSLDDDGILAAALRVGVLCNGAELKNGEASGDPLEVALLAAGRDAGLPRDALLEDLPLERTEPFNRETKMMATFHREGNRILVAVKGAPEAVLRASTQVITLDNSEPLSDQGRDHWRERNRDLAADGLRLLALAYRTVDDADAEPYQDLTLIGLVGLLDPPRQDAPDAIRQARDAGIRMIMLTGDQPETARSIAEAVGLAAEGDITVVHGRELRPPEELPDEERQHLLAANVFARVSPEQKLDLVQLHQQAGSLVAMTGDGINDSPALKQADIGVAMGQRGTDVAREAADMVLKDDAFATIVAAIRQGRAIFDNIRRFIIYLLSGNAGEILAISVTAAAGLPLPLLPLQILFINVVSDAFPALALGVGGSSPGIMQRPPRDPQESILTGRHWGIIGAYGALIAASVLIVFGLALWWFQYDQTLAVTLSFLTFGFARLWHVFNMRSAKSSLWINEVTTNPFVWGALALGVGLMLIAVYLPGLNTLLQTTAPGLEGWALVAAGSLAPLLVVQAIKQVRGG